MASNQTKELWRSRIERLLATDMGMTAWCDANKVSDSSMFKWIGFFADTEPELFGGPQNIASRNEPKWITKTRENMRASSAPIVAAGQGFLRVDVAREAAQGARVRRLAEVRRGHRQARLRGRHARMPRVRLGDVAHGLPGQARAQDPPRARLRRGAPAGQGRVPKAIVDAIDCASEDVQWYANAKTGEVRCFACSYDSEIDDEEDGFEADVPLFALSTFDTDYIPVKEERLGNAVAALREDGCGVAEADQQ